MILEKTFANRNITERVRRPDKRKYVPIIRQCAKNYIINLSPLCLFDYVIMLIMYSAIIRIKIFRLRCKSSIKYINKDIYSIYMHIV